MSDTNVWRTFFDAHAPKYMDEPFVRATLAEVDFLLDLLQLPAGSSILDMGCGTGRHSVELAKRGYRMTGVDISAGMLAEARKAAEAAGVEVELVQSDATAFATDRSFDAAICLCEGAFTLTGLDESPIRHDLAILRNIASALKPGAPFVLTALNGFRHIRQFTDDDIAAGRFDPLTITEINTIEKETSEGVVQITLREKGYLPQELSCLISQAGLTVDHIWGGTAGDWGRRPIRLDEMELMVVSHKP